jgi:hypothetical protein
MSQDIETLSSGLASESRNTSKALGRPLLKRMGHVCPVIARNRWLRARCSSFNESMLNLVFVYEC